MRAIENAGRTVGFAGLYLGSLGFPGAEVHFWPAAFIVPYGVADVGVGGVLAPPELAGEIIGIGTGYVTINKDILTPPIIDNTKFVLFAKKAEVNESSLKGYYADVTFENHSNTYVELFAISSDIALSSK